MWLRFKVLWRRVGEDSNNTRVEVEEMRTPSRTCREESIVDTLSVGAHIMLA